jgi:hypothetical protein
VIPFAGVWAQNRSGAYVCNASVPEYQRSEVVVALQLMDGRIMVADQWPIRAAVLQFHWRYLRTVGREGSGPGEFRGPGNLALAGDPLLVFDCALALPRRVFGLLEEGLRRQCQDRLSRGRERLLNLHECRAFSELQGSAKKWRYTHRATGSLDSVSCPNEIL